MLNTLIFDLDGTLVDTSEDLTFSVNHMRRQLGMAPISTREVLQGVGFGVRHLVVHTLNLSPKSPARIDQLVDQYRAHYRQHQGKRSVLYPGITQMLQTLFPLANLFVLSNKPHQATIRQVEMSGLAPYFKGVFGGGYFPHLKPAPDGIAHVLRKTNVSPTQCAMIGDMPVDVESAQNAGVRPLYVTWGFGEKEKMPPAITHISHPDQIVARVKK